MIRRWMVTCSHCVKRDGQVRRSSIACRSSSLADASAQRAGEEVGRGDRVLDREVDADAADRRHGVRGVADAEQARPPPFRSRSTATVSSLTSSQLCEFADAIAEERRHLDDALAERLEALRLHALDRRPWG